MCTSNDTLLASDYVRVRKYNMELPLISLNHLSIYFTKKKHLLRYKYFSTDYVHAA